MNGTDLAADPVMETLRQDVRGALRLLVRSPLFAGVVILTMAIAIGATCSVFSVVRGLLLKPLPYPEPQKLVRFHGSWRQFPTGTVSLAGYRQDHEHLSTMSGVAAWGYGGGSLAGAGPPEQIGLGRATSSLLPVLGVQPALGRWFSREEEEPGRGRVIVLGPALWRRRFGADPGVLGRTVEISGHPFQIVGVLAQDLELPENFDAWRPLPFPPDQVTPQSRGRRFLRVIGRLGRGVTLADARSELAVVSARLRAAFPAVYPADAGFEMTAVPLLDEMVGGVRLTLWMLFGAVVLVLLMACANVGNLLLARATARERELAVRAALGAGRARLVRQMLVESVFLALLGGALGVAIAVWGVDLLLAAGPSLPRARHVRVDGAVVAFALGASVSSGILFGLLPALTTTQARLQDALRGGSASAAPRPRRLRRALVAADVALALVLVSGAALLLRSFGNVVKIDPGFRPYGAVALNVSLPGGFPDDQQRQRTIFRSILQRLRELPGTTAAGGVDYAPLSGVPTDQPFEIEGHPVPVGAQPPDEENRTVTPGWFEAMGIPVLRGRTPQETDAADKAPVVFVNESFARKYWPAGDALGRRLRMSGDQRWWAVAGVVGDVREFGLDAEIRPTMYFPHDQLPADTLTLVVRSMAPARDVMRGAQQVLAAIDPRLPAYQMRSLNETLGASLAQRGFALKLLHGFAALALMLAGLGLYGVLAYAVTQRTREIGVRMALGARPAQALALVARESAAVVGTGLLLGSAGALASARFFAGLLFGVGPTDPLALLAAVLVLGAISLAATLLPARRAALVDPAVALRAE